MSEPVIDKKETITARFFGRVTFDSDSYRLPEDLNFVEDKVYILTCFASNIYIHTFKCDKNQFAVTNTYGDPLMTGREYGIIEPAY